MTLEIRIRNVLGISKADIGLDAITLVGGLNGAGKSSLLEATACAATGTPLARGVPNKGKAAALLREGAEAGSVTIKHGKGTVRVDWPDAAVTTEGGAAQLGTPLGIGSKRWMEHELRERMSELSTRLALAPTEQDILAWLKAKDHVFRDDKKKDITAKTAASLFERIEEQGWDGTWKTAKESVTKKKGAWEHVTAEKFGTNKSANWRPRVLEADEIYTIEGTEAAVAEAKAAYDAALKAGAISSDALKRLAAEADRLPDLSVAADAVEAEVHRLSTALERETAEQNALPLIEPPPNVLGCPHCKALIEVKPQRATPGVYTLSKAAKMEEGRTERELIALKRKHDAAIQAILGIKEELESAQGTLVAALRAKEAAEKAATQLAIEKQKPQVDDEALGQAKQALTEAEIIRDATRAMIEGKKLYEDIARSLPLIDALAPEGVRAAKVAQGMAEFNAELAALSSTAGFKEVQVSPVDGAATLNGRAYALLSESERWRCDFIVGAALARREGSGIFLVDRLDILHPSARPGVLYVLRDLGIPTLVAMTAKDRENLPALEDHGLGKTIWLNEGTISAQ